MNPFNIKCKIITFDYILYYPLNKGYYIIVDMKLKAVAKWLQILFENRVFTVAF